MLLLLAPATFAEDVGWPVEIDAEGGWTVTLYQPQVDRLEENDLHSRAAVSVTGPGVPEPAFGAVWIVARLEVDRDRRMMNKKQGATSRGAGQLGPEPSQLATVDVSVGLVRDMRIKPDDAPAIALESECERAIAFRKQFGENLAQIAPIVMITGDDAATMYPISERLAQHDGYF